MKLPHLKKRSRYQKARAALRDMIQQVPARHKARRRRAHASRTDAHDIPEHEQGFAGLHWMTGGLFLAAGAEAALGERRGDHRPSEAVRWAPVVAAPMAGAAQAARAIWPSQTTRVVAQLVNGVAIGVGAAGLFSSVRASMLEQEFEDEELSILDRMPSFAPLAFGAVGLLALLLDRDEEQAAEAVTRAPATAAAPLVPRRRRGDVKRIRIRV